jgi:hypothetical protein
LSAHAAPAERLRGGRALTPTLARVGSGTWLGAGIAAVLCAIAFGAGGGLALGPATNVEMGLTLGGAALVLLALAVEERAPLYGFGAAGLLFALAAFTAASVIWSVQPGDSWVEANRTLAYAFTFAGGIALVRLAPARWPSLLGGVLVAAVVVSSYAVATKVFPSALSASEIYARLREPFGYWNAVGLAAALGIPPCLWLGARRSGHGALGALAYPAVTVLLVALMLSYSRGALLALAIGCAFWFAAVPLRLRGLSVLVLGALGAVPVVAWAFGQSALTTNSVALGDRVAAGHRLGLLVIVAALFVLAAGLAVRFAATRQALSPRTRYRAGLTALLCLALLPVGGAVALTFSSRGLGGSVSHAWRTLTDPNATQPPNDPSRLTAIGSVRARYWNDALQIFRDHPIVGVGAGGYPTARARYRSDTIDVQHAHGYVVQTLADLGLVGLALSLLLAAAWIVAAIRGASPFGWRARAPAYTPERIGLLTLSACVVLFAAHSLVDWTWFVPFTTCVALLCAGWVAGRGRHDTPLASGRPSLERLRTPLRAAGAAAVAALALIVAWAQWQPQRSVDADSAALTALAHHDYSAATAAAKTAINRDPLSAEPLFDLAVIQTAVGQTAAAHATLQSAVRLQPSNALTWERLADFELTTLNDRKAALRDLGAALYLDPQSHAGIDQYLLTLRSGTVPAGPPTGAPAANPAGTT